MHRRFFASSLRLLALTALVALPAGTVRAADWTVFGHNAAHSSDAADTALTPATIGRLHRRWISSFDDIADSTPILLSHVKVGTKTRALLFQTTKHGTTYAIDATTGATVWAYSTRPPTITAHTPGGDKITTSTPVADPNGRYIYVPSTNGLVHKLDAAIGKEVVAPGFPLRITMMPDVEKNASPLNLANGYLYAATSGYIGDAGPYDGHVVALRLRDGQKHVFNSLCSNVTRLLLNPSYDQHTPASCAERESGIWSRGGVVVDPDPSMGGRIYVATGNGTFDANKGGHNYGDTMLALSADGSHLLDYYTPSNYQALQDADLDIGSTAPLMLPSERGSKTPLMAVQGGKDSVVDLVDRRRLGGVGGELQALHVPGAVLFSAPAVWQDAKTGTWVYLGTNSNVTALHLTTNARGASRLSIAWTAQGQGTSPVVVNGMVVVAGSGDLRVLDARTGRLLWTSTSSRAGGSIGSIHWESPIVVNRTVYVSDESMHLTAYAL